MCRTSVNHDVGQLLCTGNNTLGIRGVRAGANEVEVEIRTLLRQFKKPVRSLLLAETPNPEYSLFRSPRKVTVRKFLRPRSCTRHRNDARVTGESFLEHLVLGSRLYDNVVRQTDPKSIEKSLTPSVHQRERSITVSKCRNRIDKFLSVPPTPEGDLAGDILTTVLIVHIRVRTLQGRIKARPPRIEES